MELENASGECVPEPETFHLKPEKSEHHRDKVILVELRFQKIRTRRAQLEPILPFLQPAPPIRRSLLDRIGIISVLKQA